MFILFYLFVYFTGTREVSNATDVMYIAKANLKHLQFALVRLLNQGQQLTK